MAELVEVNTEMWRIGMMLLLALSSCGDDAAMTPAPGADASVSTSKSDAGNPDAESPGSTTGARFTWGEAPGTGKVGFFYPGNGSKFESTFTARFTERADPDPCSLRIDGDCSVRTCPVTNGSRVQGTFTPGDLGRIEISGGNPAYADAIELRADGYTRTGVANPPRGAFLGGEPIQFKFAKDEKGTLSTTFPLVLLLNEPHAPDAGDAVITLPIGSDLALVFDRGAADVELWVSSLYGTDQATSVFCRFETVSGHATIPKSILSAIVPNNDVALYTVRVVDKVVGGFATTTAIASDVFTPDKKRPIRFRSQ